jgi:hypothetical protein
MTLIGDIRNIYKISFETENTWKTTCRRDDLIEVDLKETVLQFVEWIRRPQDRDQWWILVAVVTEITMEPRSCSIKLKKFMTNQASIRFSGKAILYES